MSTARVCLTLETRPRSRDDNEGLARASDLPLEFLENTLDRNRITSRTEVAPFVWTVFLAPSVKSCRCLPRLREQLEDQVLESYAIPRARTSCSNKASRPLGFCLFPVNGDGSVGYGRMMACSEWPIALRVASSASAIGGGPQRKITVSGPGGGRCARSKASVMRPVPCDQPAGGCSNT